MESIKEVGTGITSHSELKLRIMHLSARKEEQEEEIKKNIKELYYSIHPGFMLKNAANDMIRDTELATDLKKLGVHIGTDLAVGRLFGKNFIAGYFSSFIARKLILHLLDLYPNPVSTGWKRLKKILKISPEHAS